MKEELLKQILVENTLYTTDLEKDEFLSSDSNIINAFMYNFVGILGAYESAQVIMFNRNLNKNQSTGARKMLKDIKQYMKQDGKLRIDSITDDNNNISLILKLMKEKDMFINVAKLNEMIRFLVKFKQGTVDRIDESILREWIGNIKKPFLNKVDQKIKSSLLEFIDGKQNIYDLTGILRKNYKRLKDTVGEDFWTAVKYVHFKAITDFSTMSPFMTDMAPIAQQAADAIDVTDTQDDTSDDVQQSTDTIMDSAGEKAKQEAETISKATQEFLPSYVISVLDTISNANASDVFSSRIDAIREAYDGLEDEIKERIVNTYLILTANLMLPRRMPEIETEVFTPILDAGKYILENYAKEFVDGWNAAYNRSFGGRRPNYENSFFETKEQYADFLYESVLGLIETGKVDVNDGERYKGFGGMFGKIMTISESVEVSNKLKQIINYANPYNETLLDLFFNTFGLDGEKYAFIAKRLMPDLFGVIEAMMNGTVQSYQVPPTIKAKMLNIFGTSYRTIGIVKQAYIDNDMFNPKYYSFYDINAFIEKLSDVGIANILGSWEKVIRQGVEFKEGIISIKEVDFNYSFSNYEYKNQLIEWMLEGKGIDKTDALMDAMDAEGTAYPFYVFVEAIMNDSEAYEKLKRNIKKGEAYGYLASTWKNIDNKELGRKFAIDMMEYNNDVTHLGISSYQGLGSFTRNFDLTANMEETKRLLEVNNKLGNPIFSKENIKNISRRADKDALLSDMFDMIYDLKEVDAQLTNDFFDSIDKYYQDKIRVRGIGVDAVMKELQEAEIELKDKVNVTRVKQIFSYNGLNADEIAKGYTIRKKKGQTITDYFKDVETSLANTSSLEPLKVSNPVDKKEVVVSSTKRLIENYYAGKHGNFYPIVVKEFDANLEFPDFEQFKEYCKANYGSLEQINPCFHGTGGIAASMILRYGFTVIPSGDASAVGRMLGDGIYFSNKIDKVAQYASNAGYARRYGVRGYIFEMESILGKERVDYQAAGLGNDGIRSPEWAVRDPRKQLKITKVYEVEMTSFKGYKSYIGEPVNESFLDFVNEARKEKDQPDFETFIFHDNMIPVRSKDGGYELVGEEYFKKYPNDNVSFFNGKATVSIPSNKTVVYDKLGRRLTTKELKYFLNKFK